MADENVNTPEVSDEDMIEKYKDIFEVMRKETRTNVSGMTYHTRVSFLKKIADRLLELKEEFCKAVSDDFGNRSDQETLIAEVFTTYRAIKYILSNLKKWVKKESRSSSVLLFPAKSSIVCQPMGVVGILSPWNYPINLALVPVAYAIAAGNRVMLKPSELTPKTSALLKKLLETIFPANMLFVCLGGPKVAQEFSKMNWDHVFFTGSPAVGKHIARAAAENLTPATLELGGKCPAILEKGTKMADAAGILVYGKLNNSGQTCVAPDYAFVHEDDVEALMKALQEKLIKMFPTLLENPEYTSIINDKNYQRLLALIDDAKEKGAKVIELKSDEKEELPNSEKRKLPLTVIQDLKEDMEVLKEEIFGPILPMKTYSKMEDVVGYINDHDRPLAVYYIGGNKSERKTLISETISGAIVINDVLIHCAVDDLPFGGVGLSGMGRYHGYEGFLCFSNPRALFKQSSMSQAGIFRPPYGSLTGPALKLLMG